MFTVKGLIGGSLLVFVLAGAALAQENRRPPIEPPQDSVPAAPLVTATATAMRVRFVAPGTVVQLRLEVYSESGQKVFDTELHGGNVLDWHLQDGAGERLPAGSYACVLTIKGLSGRMSQRVGLVMVNDKREAIKAAGAAQLSLVQQQAVGPVEGNAAFTVLPESEAEAMTAAMHDGTNGQVARTRGALSFRLGDFFSGKDREQMRLTEEGNFGIGTDKPQAKLDVAGAIRTRKGIEFANGTDGTKVTKLTTTATGGLQQTMANGTVVSNATGTGSQDRLAKWIDNAGTLGDSLLGESGGGVELHSPAAGVGINPIFINPNTLSGFSQLQAYPSIGPDTNLSFAVIPRGTGGVTNNRAQLSLFNTDYIADPNNYEFAALRARGPDFVFGTGRAGTGQNRPFMFAAGFLSDNTTNNGQLYLATNGNVGIGTTVPGQKLTVKGLIESTSGGFKFPDATILTSASNLSKILASRVTISAANSPFSAGSADIIGVDVTSGPVTVILPAANSVSSGKIVIVKNEAGDASINNITIQRRGSDFINANQVSVAITFGLGTAAFKFYSDWVSRWYQF